jgi:hypothetical protein
MQATAAEIDEILILLEEAPQRLASLTSGFDNTQLGSKPDNDSWSANDILAHLRSCADVWGKSILAMISQDHPKLRYVSPRTWMRKTDYPAQEFTTSFQAFAGQRIDLLESLRRLGVADWSRGATFTGTARGREQTVFSYARRLAEHETQHLAQIKDVLNAVQN